MRPLAAADTVMEVSPTTKLEHTQPSQPPSGRFNIPIAAQPQPTLIQSPFVPTTQSPLNQSHYKKTSTVSCTRILLTLASPLLLLLIRHFCNESWNHGLHLNHNCDCGVSMPKCASKMMHIWNTYDLDVLNQSEPLPLKKERTTF